MTFYEAVKVERFRVPFDCAQGLRQRSGLIKAEISPLEGLRLHSANGGAIPIEWR